MMSLEWRCASDYISSWDATWKSKTNLDSLIRRTNVGPIHLISWESCLPCFEGKQLERARIDKKVFHSLKPEDRKRLKLDKGLTILEERSVRWDIESQTFVTNGSDGKSFSVLLDAGDFESAASVLDTVGTV